MWFVCLLTALLTVCIDFFLARSISDLYLNTGFLIIVFLMIHGFHNNALFIAVVYGILLDIISPISPFGTFIIVHLLMWLILKHIINIFTNISNKIFILLIFFSSGLYIAVLNIIQYIGINVFTEFSTNFESLFSFDLIFSSAILSAFIVFLFIIIAHFGYYIFSRWFFIK
ncbi:hypothetical protein KKF64_01185 [Patescibacteria group bacterium]|nr:hypothetical protein [Patescibacteria group bacterium]